MSDDLREKVRTAQERIGLTDEEVESGACFSSVADPTDARWQIITLRMPRVVNLDDTKIEGRDAQWRMMKFALANAKGVCDMLMQTLPLHLVSTLALEQVSQALEVIATVVAAIDEKRHEKIAEAKASSDA